MSKSMADMSNIFLRSNIETHTPFAVDPLKKMACVMSIQLFLQRLSQKSVKAYSTMSIGIMGGKSLVFLIEVQSDSAIRNEKEGIRPGNCAVSLNHAETP